MNQAEIIRAAHDEFVKRLSDEGKLIEVGFMAMRAAIIPITASEGQVSDMRIAFMAGAQHLYGSIMSMMESDREPTDADMRRMSLIASELEAFGVELKFRVQKPKGEA